VCFSSTEGDAAKDVAFGVVDCKAIYAKAIARGAVSVQEPKEESDEFGKAITATVKTYGDTVHTFVQRQEYKGAFLPGYKAMNKVRWTTTTGMTRAYRAQNERANRLLQLTRHVVIGLRA
jgi:4-hydroxyphenylpyruvate dioxygenase-like putative hemolysin